MKRYIKTGLAILAVMMLLMSASRPSLDGRAVVADDGVLPAGMFAKSVGYLPGDSVVVTNPATGMSVDVMILGSISSSEGVAILLSPEAAAKLFITKGANIQVKITKKASSYDEDSSVGILPVTDARTKNADPDKIPEEAVPDNVKSAVAEQAKNTDENAVGKEEAKLAEVLPTETLPAEVLPTETLPADALPTETLPAETTKEAMAENVQPVQPEQPELASTKSSPDKNETVQSIVVPEESEIVESPKETTPAETLNETPNEIPSENLLENTKDVVIEEVPSEPLIATEEDVPAKKDEADKEKSIEIPESIIIAGNEDDGMENNSDKTDDTVEEIPSIIAENTEVPLEKTSDGEFVDIAKPEAVASEPIADASSADTIIASPDEKAVEEVEPFAPIVLLPADTNPPPKKIEEDVPEIAAIDENAIQNEETAEVEIITDEIVCVENIPEVNKISENTKTIETEKAEAEAEVSVEEVPPVAKAAVEDDELAPIVLEPKAAVAEEKKVADESNIPVEQQQDMNIESIKYFDSTSLLQKGSFYIQVAVFADETNVEKLQKKYGEKYPISYVKVSTGKIQALVGPLSVDEYETVLLRFRNNGFKDAFVRKF